MTNPTPGVRLFLAWVSGFSAAAAYLAALGGGAAAAALCITMSAGLLAAVNAARLAAAWRWLREIAAWLRGWWRRR